MSDNISGREFTTEDDAYLDFLDWKKSREPSTEEIWTQIQAFKYLPTFSIVVPVYNTDKIYLEEFIQSVLSQTYPYFELCIADDASTENHVVPYLEKMLGVDSRIKVTVRDENGHISECTNSALSLATGDFICLMDNDDTIEADALFQFARVLNEDPDVDMIYSDEDKLDLSGRYYEPFFKPDWSPETLEGCMYTAHFACYRHSIVRQIGGFSSNHNGAQDYDFVLKFTEITQKIKHVPKVLYHWRAIPGSTAHSMEEKDYTIKSAVAALEDRVKRVWGNGDVKVGPYLGCFEVNYEIIGNPKISVVIPTAGKSIQLRGVETNLLENLLEKTDGFSAYKNTEIIIVDNNDLSPETLKFIKKYNVKLLSYEGDINIAKKINMGATAASGDFLLLLNDDIEPIEPNWINKMLQLCQRPGVGAVGAKLLYENQTVQHAGVAFGESLPDHIRRHYQHNDPGYFFSSCSNRNYLAVTGAVMMVSSKVFKEVNGFNEDFRVNYNDIDFCLKLIDRGYRNVFCAAACLYHFESVSRGGFVDLTEIELFKEKWSNLANTDSYYSFYLDGFPPNYLMKSIEKISMEKNI